MRGSLRPWPYTEGVALPSEHLIVPNLVEEAWHNNVDQTWVLGFYHALQRLET